MPRRVGANVMTEETRAARRPGRRGPEFRCRAGVPAGAAASTVPAASAVSAEGAPAARPGAAGPAVTAAVGTGLTIETAQVRGDTAVAAVTGEIDLHTADTLRARLIEMYGAGFRRLVVDFAAVPFCDAAGLGALVAAHNQVSASGGEIVLAGVRPAQLRLLRITGLHRLFALHPDADRALTEGPPRRAS
ncbi:STAS domain-containing protein [Actinomadura sp. NEAU-AAG7]|uniref:STAS domain-containing protein n=1 Tax=Actinomadura sp. NEAU-AAG7 TaxID=2839640 RepID=UPI001BE49B27|nr:STAS domain-containing protein [Actinomadura sp. NEAU-AAG7]MBT2213989.1 STAS domain-containing protein [Actinomadura sp. NEAU-AAG7]